MNAAHLHLMLNHLPVLGTAFGLVLLAWALWKRSDELKRVSLGTLVLATLFAVPAYVTGEPAEDVVEKLPGVTHTAVEQHEGAAQVALTAQIVLGIGALAGLAVFRKGRPVPRWYVGSILAGAFVVAVLMARTANLGGEVRHPEIRSGSATARLRP